MSSNKKLFLLLILFITTILVWIAVFIISQDDFLEVNFFDIGQGDSIFIETPKGNQILIDGGPDSTILEKLGKEMPFWDRTIDLVILTHPEKDHIKGLLEVLKRYQVENILWTGVSCSSSLCREWQDLILKEGANIKIAQAGQVLKMGKGVYFNILYPFENLEGKEVKNLNNTSIVFRLVFRENSFLFTGDTSKSIEYQLLICANSWSNSGKFLILDSDVLKVGHHGSKTSSSQEFLEKVSPEIAVIQAGKDNSYGHPHQEVLETLAKYDIKVLRTDLNGDIKIISNGIKLYEKCSVSNF